MVTLYRYLPRPFADEATSTMMKACESEPIHIGSDFGAKENVHRQLPDEARNSTAYCMGQEKGESVSIHASHASDEGTHSII